jgi:hypothetical protein
MKIIHGLFNRSPKIEEECRIHVTQFERRRTRIIPSAKIPAAGEGN